MLALVLDILTVIGACLIVFGGVVLLLQFLATEPEKVFTGNCMVRQHTFDGHSVGPCWHSTYNGRCHLHGDVALYLDDLAPWPKDFELEERRR